MASDMGMRGNESFPRGTKAYPHQKVIASYVSKILRDHFGKGPESVSVAIGGNCFTIHLRNFLTSSERLLLQEEHQMIIHQTREKLMQIMIPEIVQYIEGLTGVKPSEFYYDWDLHSMSGMIAVFCAEPLPDAPELVFEYEMKRDIEREIIRISKQTEKEPEETSSFEIYPRTIVVVRKGILIPIEKELIRVGHGELLKVVKRNLERHYLSAMRDVRTIAGRKLHNLYIDYNYESDKSVIVMVW